jgi:hypothetical protein
MIMTQERMILKGQAQLEEMAAFVRRCSRDGRPIDEVERGLWSSLLRLGHMLLVSYVEGVGSGDVGDTLPHEGRELRRLEANGHETGSAGLASATTVRCDWLPGTEPTTDALPQVEHLRGCTPLLDGVRTVLS